MGVKRRRMPHKRRLGEIGAEGRAREKNSPQVKIEGQKSQP